MLVLTKELVTTEPENLAKKWSVHDKNSNQQVSSNQARKFYDDFLLLQKRAKQCKDEQEFKDKILPLVMFSQAKLAYAVGRKTITKDFQKTLVEKIKKIENRNDLDTFLLFYQALIAYLKFESIK
jgi:CRISPR type III-A-associated protein Csm2